MPIDTILNDFEGIILSDSDSSWNHVGTKWQKCLLHYLRNIYTTQEVNKSKEFQKFSHELVLILKNGIKLEEKYKDNEVGTMLLSPPPPRLVKKLKQRISRLVAGTYQDADCLRFVKRLKREASHLFTFLEEKDIEYHNNASERALRPFSKMRQVLYGSRSKRGLENTEIMSTVYATCEMRRINPYHFLVDYLNGRLSDIPRPENDDNDNDKKEKELEPQVVASVLPKQR